MSLWVSYLSKPLSIRLKSMHYVLHCSTLQWYTFFYRYLSEFLYAWLMSTLSRADSSQMAEERIMEEQQKGRSSKKTKKKKKGIWDVKCNSDLFFLLLLWPCWAEIKNWVRVTWVGKMSWSLWRLRVKHFN